MTMEQRREARDAVRHPGRFEGQSPMVPLLYDLSLNGIEDDWDSFGEDGYVDYWYQLGRWTVHVNDQGFISGVRHKSREDASAEMEAVRADYEFVKGQWEEHEKTQGVSE